MTKSILFVSLVIALLTAGRMEAQENRFEADIQKFEERDKVNPPPKNAILFTGSSSIRFWYDLEKDFEGIPVINRGFGGAQFSDVIYFMDRIVTPYQPKTIVIYAGSLDLRKEGGGPEEVLRMFKAFRAAVLEELPDTRICYISMKPSLAKWETIHLDKEANRLIAAYCSETANTEFIDIWPPMLGEGTKPSEDYFKPDRNHPNEKCYQLWAGIIRDYIE